MGIWYVRGTGLCAWARKSRRVSSVHVTEVADWLVLHYAQVVHGTAECNLDSLADAGCAALHHFDLVYGLVHPQRNQLGSRKPLPGGKETAHVAPSDTIHRDPQRPTSQSRVTGVTNEIKADLTFC